MRRSSRTPWRGSCEGVGGLSCPRSPLGLCERVPRSVDPEGSGEEPVSGSLSPSRLSPRLESSSLCPPCPALGITPSQALRGRVRASPEAAGRAEGASGDQLQGSAQTAPWPRCSQLARLGRPQAMGWVSRLPVAGRTTHCDRLEAWEELLLGTSVPSPGGGTSTRASWPPGRSVPHELSFLGRFCLAAPGLPPPPRPHQSPPRGPPDAPPVPPPAASPGSLTAGRGVLRPLVPSPWTSAGAGLSAGPGRPGPAVHGSGALPLLPPGPWAAAPAFWSQPQGGTQSLLPDGLSSLGFARVGGWEAGPVPGIAARPPPSSSPGSPARLSSGETGPTVRLAPRDTCLQGSSGTTFLRPAPGSEGYEL